MNSKLLAILVSGALGLVPVAAVAADAKADCAAVTKKAAECKKANSTTDECKKAAEMAAGECKPKKKKKGGC